MSEAEDEQHDHGVEISVAEVDNNPQENHEDDEFDDFNEAGDANEEDDDDDDFGDFGDVNYIESTQPNFDEVVLGNNEKFIENLSNIMSTIFPAASAVESEAISKEDDANSEQPSLLNERSATIFQQVSTLPYLHPASWTRSKIRHSLLVQLGIPINLDELSEHPPPHTSASSQVSSVQNQSQSQNQQQPRLVHTASSSISNLTRRRSITSGSDIDWTGFDIPEFSKLEIDSEQETRLLESTVDTLATIEYDNLANSSLGHLESVSVEVVDEKLHQLESHYDELIKLSSCWQHRIGELHSDFEIYEGVVQSFIGYSQKLRRQEILENLKKVRHTSSTKKKFWT
ncbi:hypothetical protein JA1_000712 [Spathaspora sp. JA1]|nr:hypothetical protein JA1_000712 [Spathaspora sp. JA1]